MFNIFIPFVIWIILAIVLSMKGKNNQSGSEKQSYSKKTTYTVKKDYNQKKNDLKKTVQKKANVGKLAGSYESTNEDYDKVSMDYCESTISEDRGISFRGLRPGADEMEILERRNAHREKELEKALHGEHSHS